MAPKTSGTPQPGDEEEPLDPRLEAVAAKMRRLSMVSSGIMFLGVFAVLGVILYRSLSGPSTAAYPDNLTADEVRSVVMESMPGATVSSMSLDERSLFVSAMTDGGAVVLEIDRATWQVVSTLRFAQ